MKPWIAVISLVGLMAAQGCVSQPPWVDPFTRSQIDWRPALALDADEAGRILGSRSRLDKITAYADEGTRTFLSAFRNDPLQPASDPPGVLGYMYEEYQSAAAARAYLDSTLQANRLRQEDAIRIDGAELHYFTGGDVVRMVMILKENRLVRLKVNPVPGGYSLAELRNVAAELARRL